MRLTENAETGQSRRRPANRWLLLLVLAAGTLSAAQAGAEGIPRDEGFMKEPKVVDYRKYLLASKFDLGAFFAMSIKPGGLTTHYGGMLDAAYNFNEFWALDLMLDGGYGGVSDLTNKIRAQENNQGTFSGMPMGANPTAFSDIADAGALYSTFQLGVRWTPIYGKINLAAEFPVHFNFYFNLGAGGAIVQYNEILGCEYAPTTMGSGSSATGTCGTGAASDFHNETHATFAFNVGGGARFYLSQLLSVRLELRDIMYPDMQYPTVYTGQGFLLPNGTQNPTRGTIHMAGLTQNPLLFIGVGFLL